MEKIYADWVYAMNSTRCRVVGEELGAGLASFHGGRAAISDAASFEMISVLQNNLFLRCHHSPLGSRISTSPRHGRPMPARSRQRGTLARAKTAVEAAASGPTDMDYLRMEEFGDMFTQLCFFQLQRNIENPIIHFKNIVGKIAYIASLFLKLGYLVGVGFGHRSHRGHCFKKLVRSGDRLGPCFRTCDYLRLGSTGPDCNCSGRHSQDCDSPKYAGY